MASISGTLKVGEATATVATLMAKQRGSQASYWGVLFALISGGAALGALAVGVISSSQSPDYSNGAIVGVIVGVWLYLAVCQRLTTARFRRNFKARQHTLELPIRIEISDRQLVYEVGGVTQLAIWPAVDELFRSHEYWIFMAQAHAMYAPRRLFASEADEKSFISEALAHMSAEARSRSADAQRFLDA